MDRSVILAAMRDAETKAWEAGAGYKFWMFGYHAARWVNYNQLLPSNQRFRNPFKIVVDASRERVEKQQDRLPNLEIEQDKSQAVLGFEGDGA